MNLPIRLVVIGIPGLAVLASLLAFGTYAYQSARASLIEARSEELLAIALVQRRDVDLVFSAWTQRLGLVTSRTRMRQILAQAPDEITAENEAFLRKIMKDVVRTDPAIEAFTILDREGGPIATEGTARLAPETGLNRVRLDRMSEATVLELSRTADGPRMALAMPIAEAGRTLAIGVFELTIDELVAVVENYEGLGETGETLLARRMSNGNAQFIVPSRHDRDAAFTRQVSKNRGDVAVIQALEGRQGVMFGGVLDYRGKSVMAATQYLPDLRWALVTKIDMAEALAPARVLLRNHAVFGFTIFIISIALSIFASQLMISPLSRLAAATRQIRQGEKVVVVEGGAITELGDLAQTFNEMTRRLTSAFDELETVSREVFAADRAKSAFLANMSHELRTPLNAIIGFSEIIKSESLGAMGNEKYRRYIIDINEAGVHLLGLINGILNLSKVEAGSEELCEERLKVADIVEFALMLVRQRAAANGVRLESEVQDDMPDIRADEGKLRQVLGNLLSNAVKFTRAPGKVEVKAWCNADSGFVFQVVDTGIGIAPKDIPMALSRFGQVDRGLDRAHEGTGLGLPLAKALVELHGGVLDLQSQPGVGTTVTVRLPSNRIVDLEELQPAAQA